MRVEWPRIIQGGMGAGVSNYVLANAVARQGALGVVSGTALETIMVRRLQLGDPTGDTREALRHFPHQGIVDWILSHFYIKGGKKPNEPYRPAPFPKFLPDGEGGFIMADSMLINLLVAANFVEVWLAKRGHANPVGINYLYKIRWPTLPSIYGAMLAGVDALLVGAGFPTELPDVLKVLSRSEKASVPLPLAGREARPLYFDPHQVLAAMPALLVPALFVIVSNHLGVKAMPMADGYVIETHLAGGHNAPPRSKAVSATGEPVYGEKDEVNFDILSMVLGQNAAKYDLPRQPFWLAGGFAGGLKAAIETGARGVQVGTPFAFCRESGIDPALKHDVLDQILLGRKAETSAVGSPSGFPFKVFRAPDTIGDPAVYEARRRACNLGYLFDVFDEHGDTRCPAENVTNYVYKGGDAADAVGRMCLCNGLLATVGLGSPGEKALVTAGTDVDPVKALVNDHGTDYTAAQVLEYITGSSRTPINS